MQMIEGRGALLTYTIHTDLQVNTLREGEGGGGGEGSGVEKGYGYFKRAVLSESLSLWIRVEFIYN